MSSGVGRRLQVGLDPRTWSALVTNRQWRREGPCATSSARGSPARSARVLWPAVYQHSNAGPFVRAIKGGLATTAQMVEADIDQPYEGIVVFEVEHDGDLRRVAID
jgi:hypothetical protein